MRALPTRILLAAALAATSAVASATAAAQNLVTNPGFETGDFSGWTQFGNSGFTSVSSVSNTGDHAGSFGPVSSTGGVAQTLVTTPGSTYTFSFFLRNSGGGTNSFSASFDGTSLTALNDAPEFGYTPFSYNVLATSSSSEIRFTFGHVPAYYHLDDVSVEAVPSTVPEPGTWALLGTGLLGVAGIARRKRTPAR